MKTYLTLFLILTVQTSFLLTHSTAKSSSNLKKSNQNEDILVKQLFSAPSTSICSSDPKVAEAKKEANRRQSQKPKQRRRRKGFHSNRQI